MLKLICSSWCFIFIFVNVLLVFIVFLKDDNWIIILLQSTETDPKPDENVADSAYTILFTVDLNKDVPTGLIHAGSYLDKYEKPANGFPFIK